MLKLLKSFWLGLTVWFRPPTINFHIHGVDDVINQINYVKYEFIESEWDEFVKNAFDPMYHNDEYNKSPIKDSETLNEYIKLFYKDYRLNSKDKIYEKGIYTSNIQTQERDHL
jgi:hypothetical protein